MVRSLVTPFLVASLAWGDGHPEMKIAALIQETGIGARGIAALELYEDYINSASMGYTVSVDVMPYVKGETDVSAMVSQVLDGGYHAFFTPYGSGDTTTVLEAFPNDTSIPLMLWGAASDSIFTSVCYSKGLNCFAGLTTASQYMTPSLEACFDASGEMLSVAAITNNNGFSSSVMAGAKDYIAMHPEKFVLVGDVTLSVQKTSLAEIDLQAIENLVAMKPDVFTVAGHPGDVEEVIETIRSVAKEHGVEVKAIIATNAFSTPSNYKDQGSMTGLIMPEQWAEDPMMKDSILGWTSSDFAAGIASKGQDATYHAASAGNLAVILSHAAAHSLDFTELADHIKMLKVVDTFYGSISYQAPYYTLGATKPMYGKQLQFMYEIVAPTNLATADLMTLSGEVKTMTCGDVKEMYKEADCCGNPAKEVGDTFARRLAGQRRLAASVDSVGSPKTVLNAVKSGMKIANQKSAQEAQRLADEIRKVLKVLEPTSLNI